MAYTPSTRGGSSRLLGIGALLLLGTVGAVGTLAALGKIDLPFFNRKVEPKGPPPGSVPIPVSIRTIPAYTKLTRDHFLDPNTGQLSLQYIKPEQIREGMFTLGELNKLFGRVLAQDKQAGYAFLERELLPEGTRPGVGAGVPDDGRRGMVFEAAKIHGVHNLKPGDHVDLIASLPPDTRAAALPGKAIVTAPGTVADPRTKKALVRVVAQDAVLLTGVTTRQAPGVTGSLTQGSRQTTKPIQEVVIAVSLDEIAGLSEALALDATITCVVRTNRPRKEEAEATRLPERKEPTLVTVETIRGGKREVTTFTPSGEPNTKEAK